MPGIDFKQMWSVLRPNLLTIWKFCDDCLNNPFAVVQRGLDSLGILSTASTRSVLGFAWAAFVWFATLPLVVLIWVPLFLLAIPSMLVWGVWKLVTWPFARASPTPASPAKPVGIPWLDRLVTVPHGASRLQYLWRIPLGIILIPPLVFLAELAESLFLWLILLSFGMWVFLALGVLFVTGSLFGYGVMLGRDDASAAINSFTTVCNYRNLTQREAISTTFATGGARDAFSCPWIRKITVPKEGITKVE